MLLCFYCLKQFLSLIMFNVTKRTNAIKMYIANSFIV